MLQGVFLNCSVSQLKTSPINGRLTDDVTQPASWDWLGDMAY